MNPGTASPERDTNPPDPSGDGAARAEIYGLLAALYRTEPDTELVRRVRAPAFLTALSDLGVRFDEDLSRGDDEELAEQLASDYTRLFLGPGDHLSPHESVHHVRDGSGWGTLWGEDTARVKAFIEATGLSLNPERNDIPDHIGVELELMQRLAEHEAQALADGDKATAEQAREISDRFLHEHLLSWVPGFCRQVQAGARHSFYRELAGLTGAFLEHEAQSRAAPAC